MAAEELSGATDNGTARAGVSPHRGPGDRTEPGGCRPTSPPGSLEALLAPGGEMAQLIRGFDWSETSLGPIETWSPSLRASVGTMLRGGAPLVLFWGSDLTLLYNDAWAALFPEKHPRALGRPAREALADDWAAMGGALQNALHDRLADGQDGHPLTPAGQGATPGGWVRHLLTPVRRTDGSAGGVLGLAAEMADPRAAPRESDDATAELASGHEELRLTLEEIRQHNEELQETRGRLEQERRRYEDLFALAPDGYIVTDLNGVVQEANRAASELLGLRAPALVGKPMAVFVAQEDQTVFFDLLERVQRLPPSAKRLEVELSLRPRQREPFPALLSAVAARARSGTSDRVRWMVRDVRERKAAEKAVRESETRYRTLFDSMEDGFCLVQLLLDEQGSAVDYRLLEVNRAFEKQTGLNDVVGLTGLEVEPRHREDWVDAYQRVVGTRQSQRFTSRANNLGRSFDIYAFPFGRAEERKVGVIFRDVTEQERAQHALAETERRYKELVRHAPSGIYEIDFRRNRFVSVNDAMCQMLGYSREELLELNPSQILDERSRRLFQARVNQWLSGEEPDRNVEFTARTRDGDTIEAVLDVTFTKDEAGRPLGATVVAHDVTERNQRERRIARYNRVLRGINRIFEQVIRVRTEEALGATCLAVALEVTGSELGFVGEVGADGLLHDIAISETGWEQCRMVDKTGHRRQPGDFVLHGLYGRVFDDGVSLFTNDPSAHADSIGVPQGHPPLTSFLGVPLRHEEETVGVLAVGNRAEGYGQEQQEDLEALAPAVVEALYRKRAEEELRRSRARLAWVLDKTGIGTWLNELPFGRLSWDDQTRELFFVPPDEEPTIDLFWSRLQPEDREPTRLAVEEAIREGTLYAIDHRTINPETGEVRWLHSVGQAIYAPDGTPTQFDGLNYDISERKQAEEALNLYAERLRFLHQVDEAILEARSSEEVAQAVVERVSRVVPCRVANVALHDAPGGRGKVVACYAEGNASVATDWHAQIGPPWHQVLPVLERGEPYVIEDIPRLAAGSPSAGKGEPGLRALVRAPLTTRGRLVGTLNLGMGEPGPLPPEQMHAVRELALTLAVGLQQAGLFEEVQRHAGELERLVEVRTEELKASEERFRTIFEEASIGIALADGEGRLMATNPALRYMLGYDEDELAGQSLFELLDGTGREGKDLSRRLREDDDGRVTEELALTRGDGEIAHANVTVSVLRKEGEAPALVLALMEDISDRRRAREMLVRAEQLTAMGRMGASLAHEINNPLQSVIGCLGLAMEAQRDGEDSGQLMDVAMEELKRAATIVHRMRDISRPGHGEKELGTVSELLDRVLTLTHNQAEHHLVHVVWRPESDLPRVPMVRDRIQQVFLNLVLNAIDAMRDGGELRIQSTRTDHPPGVTVSFSDTGVGIPPDELKRLFEAFQSSKKEGLGLGLYVSRSIVLEHGGEIDVESRLGKGSTFTVWLPAQEPE